DTLINYGRIFATGTLTLTADEIINSGWLGSVATGHLVIGSNDHDTTLNNFASFMDGVAPGLLDIQGGLSLTRTAVIGGGISVSRTGSLTIGTGTTFDVDSLL